MALLCSTFVTTATEIASTDIDSAITTPIGTFNVLNTRTPLTIATQYKANITNLLDTLALFTANEVPNSKILLAKTKIKFSHSVLVIK